MVQNRESLPSTPDKTPETPEFVAARTKLINRRNELMAQVNEIFGKKITASGTALDERALSAITKIRDDQKRDIYYFYEKKLRELQRLGIENAKSIAEIGKELEEQFEEEAKHRLTNLSIILDTKAGERVETKEVEGIQQTINAMEKFEKEHPELQELLVEVSDNKPLSDSDYSRIAQLWNPIDPAKASPGDEFFETTAAGLFLGIMNPEQKYNLLRAFMESRKKQDTPLMVEAWLSTGHINRRQAEKLLEEAKTKGILVPPELQKRFENTDYEALANEHTKRIEAASKKKHGGIFATNFMNKLSGKPALGFGIMLWGGITGGMNLLANYKSGDWKKPLDYFGRVATNPYAIAGAVAAAVGSEIGFGTLKKQSNTGDLIEDWGGGRGPLGSLFTAEEDTPQEREKRASEQLESLYLNAPKPMAEYLDKGGFTTMQRVREELLRNPTQKKEITLKQLLEAETDPRQKNRLEALSSMMFAVEKDINRKFTTISEAAYIMGIKTPGQMEETLQEIRTSNRVTANPQGHETV